MKNKLLLGLEVRNVYAKIVTIGQGVWPYPCGRHTDKMPNARSKNENSLR